MTPAERLAAMQRQFPPPPDAGDRVAQIVAALRPALPERTRERLDRGLVVVGEQGEAHPDVATWPVGEDGGCAITISTGMFGYLATTMRALGLLIVQRPGYPVEGALESVAEQLRDAMRTYRRQTNLLFSVLRPTFTDAEVPDDPTSRRWNETMLRLTPRFLLAHEFGHVELARPGPSDSAEELSADRKGLFSALQSALADESQSMALAAAGLSLRLYQSLERFGARFGKQYPPMAERLRVLQAALGEMIGSQQRADELSRVMVAFLDAMDDLDDRIARVKQPAAPSVDRLRIGIVARLYELARGGIPLDEFVAGLQMLRGLAQPAAFRDALESVCAYYWAWADHPSVWFAPENPFTTYTPAFIRANSRALRAAVAAFPADLRAVTPGPYLEAVP